MKEYKLAKNMRMNGQVLKAGSSIKLNAEDYKKLKESGYLKTNKKKVKENGGIDNTND